MMEIWEGFIIGILGSLHCLGMCGPLVLAFPVSNKSNTMIAIEDILYNTGRILTYAILGALAGTVGASFRFAGIQEISSIILGILIILSVLLPLGFKSRLTGNKFIRGISDKFKDTFSRSMRKNSTGSYLIIGLLNGLLPCGLVYVALTASISGREFTDSILFMLLFGLGTLPMMFAVFFGKQIIPNSFRVRALKIVPYAIIVIGIVLILRGMSLGIPYLSPALPDKVGHQAECCH